MSLRPLFRRIHRAFAGIWDVTPELIASQIDAVFEDIDVDAVKIGMVSVPETIRVIAEKLKQYRPAIRRHRPGHGCYQRPSPAGSGSRTDFEGRIAPLADVLTPNLPEAEVLTGKKIESFDDMERAAKAIAAHGS